MSEAVGMSNASASSNPLHGLSTLVYRSRATKPLSSSELLNLAETAQRRNRLEAITGLMLYDNTLFFQWLEGPDDALTRIMQSINGDARHTDIEVLARRPTARRSFQGWNMKLALVEGLRSPWMREVITPSPTLLAALRSRPGRAAHLLSLLAPKPNEADRLAVLDTVIKRQVVPRIWQAQIGAHLAGLVRLDDVEAALTLLRNATGRAMGLSGVRAELLKAAARDLGNGWSRDDCTELDVTLGLFTLHTVMRQLDQHTPISSKFAGVALVTPQSGEPHCLGAAMSARTLKARGWQVQCEFPGDDDELAGLLAATWFDRLDLSLSVAHQRFDRLGALTATIAMARLASPNRALNIVVSGRAFAEDAGLAARVGADPEVGR